MSICHYLLALLLVVHASTSLAKTCGKVLSPPLRLITVQQALKLHAKGENLSVIANKLGVRGLAHTTALDNLFGIIQDGMLIGNKGSGSFGNMGVFFEAFNYKQDIVEMNAKLDIDGFREEEPIVSVLVSTKALDAGRELDFLIGHTYKNGGMAYAEVPNSSRVPPILFTDSPEQIFSRLSEIGRRFGTNEVAFGEVFAYSDRFDITKHRKRYTKDGGYKMDLLGYLESGDLMVWVEPKDHAEIVKRIKGMKLTPKLKRLWINALKPSDRLPSRDVPF